MAKREGFRLETDGDDFDRDEINKLTRESVRSVKKGGKLDSKSVANDIHVRHGKRISHVKIAPVLARLEKNGWLRSVQIGNRGGPTIYEKMN